MLETVIALVLLAGAVVAALCASGGKLLRMWYLQEVRRVAIAEDPSEAIVTYPLA